MRSGRLSLTTLTSLINALQDPLAKVASSRHQVHGFQVPLVRAYDTWPAQSRDLFLGSPRSSGRSPLLLCFKFRLWIHRFAVLVANEPITCPKADPPPALRQPISSILFPTMDAFSSTYFNLEPHLTYSGNTTY